MARRRRAILAATVLLVLLMGAAEARPLGDFGRPEPSVLDDQLLPAIGSVRARAMGEPASSFDLTDEETEMADRIWRFETSGRTRDWLLDGVADLERTRLLPYPGPSFTIDRYYNWLRVTPYRSATTRYATIDDDVEADLATAPDTFAAICAVEAIDRQRRIASANLPGLGGRIDRAVASRLAENGQQIDAFVKALHYRYDSYNYALNRLLVETPHAEARGVDESLAELAGQVRRAERGDFCSPIGRPHVGNPHPGPAIPSRFVHGNPPAPAPAGPVKGS